MVVNCCQLRRSALLKDVVQHIGYFLGQEREWPAEEIQTFRQLIWGLCVRVLLQLQASILQNQNWSLVFVASTVVRCWENGNYVWKRVLSTPSVHVKTFLFDLMASENTKELVLAQKLLNGFLSEVIGTITFRVFFKVPVYRIIVFHWVRPHQIAENTIERDLLLPLDLVYLVKHFKTRWDSTMHS